MRRMISTILFEMTCSWYLCTRWSKRFVFLYSLFIKFYLNKFPQRPETIYDSKPKIPKNVHISCNMNDFKKACFVLLINWFIYITSDYICIIMGINSIDVKNTRVSSLRLSLQVAHDYFELVKIRALSLNKGCYQSKVVQSFTKTLNWNIIQTRLHITSSFLFRCLEDERAWNWNVWILACKTVYCELD